MDLHSATPEDIRTGRVTDVYFRRTREVLEEAGLDPHVRAEFAAKSLPEGWDWAVFAGLEEVLELAAFVGGCDGVSTVVGAELIGEEPRGTIPHSLILVIGDTVEATRAFHEVVDPSVPRVSLIDTFHDEKFEAVAVAEELGEALDSVRLDTPSTRRGDFYRLLEEVRWELDVRGHEAVDLFVSGGIDEREILRLNDVADGYGVGGAISAAPIVDFAMDIVEIEGEAAGKRGKWSGAKQVFRCPECRGRRIGTFRSDPPACGRCGGSTEPLLVPRLESGERLEAASSPRAPRAVRDRVLEGLEGLPPLEADG